MKETGVTNAVSGHRGFAPVLAVIIGGLGVLMAHHPMILSGFQRMQVNLGDTRFNNYVLEHDYRWVLGTRNHTEFWNPPFFFPERNVAAYSDVLLSVAPLYMVNRAVGLPPDTAYQLWLLTLSSLNFLLAYHVLGRRFGLSAPAASLAAILFAFGAPRINQLGHPQLLPHFPSLITIDALFGLFAAPGAAATAWKRGLLWLAAMLGVVAQLYAGFYLGWFLILSLGITAVVGLLGRRSRWVLLATLRRDVFLLAATALASGLLLWPLVNHYLDAARVFGPRYYPTVRQFLPNWKSFFYLGPDSWLWGWWVGPREAPLHEREDEKRLGIGLVTTLACGLGLYWNRDRPAIRLLLGVALGLVISTITVPQRMVHGVSLTAILLAVAWVYPKRRGRSASDLVVPGLVLAFLKFNSFPTEPLIGAGLFTLLVVVADVYRSRDEWPWCIGLGAVALGFAVWLFEPTALAYGTLLGSLAAYAGAVAGVRPGSRLALIATAGLLLFSTLTNYGHRPVVLRVACLAPIYLAVSRTTPWAPAPRVRLGVLIVALMVTWLHRGDETAWSTLCTYVPGARALHAVSRVGLMLLILWAIGLGLFVEALCVRRRPIAAFGMGLVCLLEQGVTTPSYDKDENRRAVSELAHRVDRRDTAFFYSPHNASLPQWKYQIDAMWAGLESGVPTINGYSGNTPLRWRPLTDPNIEEECDFLCLEFPLRRWIAARGLPQKRVGWVGGPAFWRTEALPR